MIEPDSAFEVHQLPVERMIRLISPLNRCFREESPLSFDRKLKITTINRTLDQLSTSSSLALLLGEK